MQEQENTIIDKSTAGEVDFGDWEKMCGTLQATADMVIESLKPKDIFVAATKKGELAQIYLRNLPESIRQQYNCNSCKSFLNRYGSLVVVDGTTGRIKSLLWNPVAVDAPFKDAVAAMKIAVETSTIARVCVIHAHKVAVYDTKTHIMLGDTEKGGYTHFHVGVPMELVGSYRYVGVKNPIDKIHTNCNLLCKSLAKFTPSTIRNIINIFNNDVDLCKRLKHLGPLQMLLKIHEHHLAIAGDGTQGTQTRRNLAWVEAAEHYSLGMNVPDMVIGKFIEKLNDDGFERAKKLFIEMTEPDVYARPQAAPTLGAIGQAEKLIEELGLESALKRRIATLSDLPQEAFIWEPSREDEKAEDTGEKKSIFSDLKKQVDESSTEPMNLTGPTMTLRRFISDVLPKAEKISVAFSREHMRGIGCYTTAVDPEAKPILKHDSEERRNPFSAYANASDHSGARFGISPNQAYDVEAIIRSPMEFYSGEEPKIMAFVLKGISDKNTRGLSLFPSTLRSELFQFRHVIEAYSNSNDIVPVDKPITGLYLGHENSECEVTAYVTTGNICTKYRIDRTN